MLPPVYDARLDCDGDLKGKFLFFRFRSGRDNSFKFVCRSVPVFS